MSDCGHNAFEATTEVHRITDGDDGPVRNFVAEVRFRCTQCDTPFHFVGPDAGFSFTKPTVSVGALTLHVPIAPGEAPLPSRIRFEMQGNNPQ